MNNENEKKQCTQKELDQMLDDFISSYLDLKDARETGAADDIKIAEALFLSTLEMYLTALETVPVPITIQIPVNLKKKKA